MRPFALIALFAVALASAAARGEPARPDATPVRPSADDLRALDRDEAAAFAATAAGDVEAALRYADYYGHEQEALARALVEYQVARAAVRQAVTEKLGRKAWADVARALRVAAADPEPSVRRSARLEGGVLYVRNRRARSELPYVKANGVWKLSIGGIVRLTLKASLGDEKPVDEATLHAAAGKMAAVVRDRNEHLSRIAAGVRAGRLTTAAAAAAAGRPNHP